MGIGIEEVRRKKNEFINSIDQFLTESNVRVEKTTEVLNRINRQAAKNMEEPSRLL